MAWIADSHRLFFKCVLKGYRGDRRRGIVGEMEGDQEPQGVDVAMDERLPDGSVFWGDSCGDSVPAQTGRKVEQSKEEASGQEGSPRSVRLLVMRAFQCSFSSGHP